MKPVVVQVAAMIFTGMSGPGRQSAPSTIFFKKNNNSQMKTKPSVLPVLLQLARTPGFFREPILLATRSITQVLNWRAILVHLIPAIGIVTLLVHACVPFSLTGRFRKSQHPLSDPNRNIEKVHISILFNS